MADRARLLISSQTRKGINIAAGCVMIAVGVFLVTKA
jgi:threonine/homoserine/homoserine lactone efflux protein